MISARRSAVCRSIHLAPALLAALLGCGGAPPPPPPAPAAVAPKEPAPAVAEAPAKEPIETGSDCAKAESQCGGGACMLFVKNGCDQAVSCDATMTTTCRAGTEMVEAARRKRETFAGKTEGEISLQGDCQGGEILRTAVKSIACK
jgi:hypothetical protein